MLLRASQRALLSPTKPLRPVRALEAYIVHTSAEHLASASVNWTNRIRMAHSLIICVISYAAEAAESLTLKPIKSISGTVRLPGSKSLSNRVLLLAALSKDHTCIENILVRQLAFALLVHADLTSAQGHAPLTEEISQIHRTVRTPATWWLPYKSWVLT